MKTTLQTTSTTLVKPTQASCKARIEEESVFINSRLQKEIGDTLNVSNNTQPFVKPDNDISRRQ
jgi:hypothetical protein